MFNVLIMNDFFFFSVELKGRGAIRMTTNEIMVTELIFRNTLSDFEPAEIAALLSCLVFQAKTNIKIEENITPRLQNVSLFLYIVSL